MGSEDARAKAEELGHIFGEWVSAPGEQRRIGGRCLRCHRAAEVVWDVPENYTEKQAVIRYLGDALNLRCDG